MGQLFRPMAAGAVSKRISPWTIGCTAPVQPAARTFAVVAATTLVTALIGSEAFGQAPTGTAGAGCSEGCAQGGTETG